MDGVVIPKPAQNLSRIFKNLLNPLWTHLFLSQTFPLEVGEVSFLIKLKFWYGQVSY